MRQLPLNRSLLFFLDQLEYSEAALSADPDTAPLAVAFREEIADWANAFEKQRTARREVVRANAIVAVRDEQLDTVTTSFGVVLLADVRGDRNSTGFRRFFPAAPSELVRRALRKQCENTKSVIIPAIRGLAETSPLYRFASQLENATKAALDALDTRAKARGSSAGASLDVEEWKEGVNRLRLSTYGALLGIAAEKHYPRSWAESFFAGTAGAGADDDEEPEVPGPTPNEPSPGVTPAGGGTAPTEPTT